MQDSPFPFDSVQNLILTRLVLLIFSSNTFQTTLTFVINYSKCPLILHRNKKAVNLAPILATLSLLVLYCTQLNSKSIGKQWNWSYVCSMNKWWLYLRNCSAIFVEELMKYSRVQLRFIYKSGSYSVAKQSTSHSRSPTRDAPTLSPFPDQQITANNSSFTCCRCWARSHVAAVLAAAAVPRTARRS